jgi:hypothetical protein
MACLERERVSTSADEGEDRCHLGVGVLEDTWRSVVEEIETRSNKPSYFANVTLTCFALLKTMTAVTCLHVKLH